LSHVEPAGGKGGTSRREREGPVIVFRFPTPGPEKSKRTDSESGNGLQRGGHPHKPEN